MGGFINKSNINQWLKRYLPAEIFCTATALICASATYQFTKNNLLTALAGTWGENIGFYAVHIGRDIYTNRKKEPDRKITSPTILNTIKSLILEFGPAEVLDSFLIRPFMMYIFPKITGNLHLGILTGKIAADIIVYIPIIISYEIQKSYNKNKY